MTHIGKALTAKGVKPIVNYQHEFKNTYLYGSFSPINGDSFVLEIEGVSTKIFETYLTEFSSYKPNELKVLVIDNAGFHSTKNITIPDNIILVNIPPYSPELNPSEKIWGYLKQKYKNRVFETLENVKEWLYEAVRNELTKSRVKSITHNLFYNNYYMYHLKD
jgi:transposase